VKPQTKVNLEKLDPNATPDFDGGKKKSQKELAKLTAQIGALQACLYAEDKHKILIVLQGMDTSGKDGVIRHVFSGVNPQGVQVSNFKVPTAVERSHDFLWRVHQKVPGKGELVIFNRSHYEDVLVVPVHGLITKKECRRRYAAINNFEAILAASGVTILKFFLHIDPEEQKQRLLERLQDPTAVWKFNPDDLKERELWPKYTQAYEDAISATSTSAAPWHIIPANHKWYRNLAIARIVVKTLEDLKMRYPTPTFDPQSIIIP